MKFILASASPQRKKLLRALGISFKVIPSRISERSSERNPRKLVALLALRKAVAVARQAQDAMVIGADTLVFCQGKILSKPKSHADALRILNILNGRWHKVYTGIAVVDAGTGKHRIGVEVTRVKARKLRPEQIARLSRKHPDKSGAYAVQDHKDPFISKMIGPRDNVIGLPCRLLKSLLPIC